MKRRLTFVLDDLGIGGAERVLLRLAGWFAAQGADVEIVTITRRGPLASEIPADADHVHLGVARVRFASLRLARHLRKRRPQAVMTTLPYTNVMVATAVALSGVRTKLILREANDPVALHRFRGPFGPARRAFTTWAYRRADAVVALTRGNGDALVSHLGLPREDVHVIGNPAPRPEAAAPPPERAPSGRPRILSVARLVRQKDHATLLEAFSRLHDLPDAALTLVGDGPLCEDLRIHADALGIADRVHFAGEVTDVGPWWSWADVLALSSRWEGFPNVLLEALAHGVQVVATDCPTGPSEVLGNGRWGKVVPIGDASALANGIREILALPIAVAELRARAEDFDVEEIGRRWLALVE